ncbi:DUF86 domain-containing protein [candidate division KSB1 bacterium]|nr:DUF86 domain-containing protein [candidate division KSB1 bacterium]
MKKINQKIKQINLSLKTAQSFLTKKSFAVYKENYITQGKILDNMKQAQEKCYDLGMNIVQQFGWKKPEKLEDLFYLLQEKGVIDSDLVDKMIAIYRIRWGLIEDNLEKDDYKLVHEILMQNFEDMNLFVLLIVKNKKYQSFDGGGFTIRRLSDKFCD